MGIYVWGTACGASELGVYRGRFARCINRLLPDRKLYLFDSFQGFDRSAGAGKAFQAAHENTDLRLVQKAACFSTVIAHFAQSPFPFSCDLFLVASCKPATG